MPQVQPIPQLTFETLKPLLDSSIAEGYDFIQKLWDEYQSGVNTFSENGAVLLGVYEGDALVGIGGVHPDPYLGEATIGRIRHVYVMPGHRRGGIGGELVRALIARSSGTFKTFTLRTMTDHGRAFYTAIGFSDAPRYENATHWMTLA